MTFGQIEMRLSSTAIDGKVRPISFLTLAFEMMVYVSLCEHGSLLSQAGANTLSVVITLGGESVAIAYFTPSLTG